MKIKFTSKLATKVTALFFGLIVLLSGASSTFAAEPPPVPAMVEGYFCKYKPGKDRDDLLAARDFFSKQADKANIDLKPTFAWYLNKGSAPVDFTLMIVHESPMAYGKAADERFGNSDMRAAAARFGSVAECTAGAGVARVIHEAEREFDGPTYITSSACHVKKGWTMADRLDLAGHINATFNELETLNDVPVYSINPITGPANRPDTVVFAVHENASAWAENTGALVSTPQGQMLGRHFSKMLDCSTAHWIGEQLVSTE